jgi:hypothetical protein
LVSLADPSLFTPEHVAYITSRTDTAQRPNFTSTFAFGRHFAASVGTRMVLAAFNCHWNAQYVANAYISADSEWEYREGILSLASLISHLSSSYSPSTTPDDRLSRGAAAKMLLDMITSGWRISTEPMEHSRNRLEGDAEVLDAITQAVQVVRSLYCLDHTQ